MLTGGWRRGSDGKFSLVRWLHDAPVTGRLALLCGVVAIILATAIRGAIDGVVQGCEFTPYLPFVMVAALLLRWWQAATVAVASVVALGLAFMGDPREFVADSCFQSSSGIFLASSAAMIGLVALVRLVFLSIQTRGADETEGGIVFSREKGRVWASWYGRGPPVLLGSERKVASMMKDYLAQVEVAKRLNGEGDS